jgi:hypothetical protein
VFYGAEDDGSESATKKPYVVLCHGEDSKIPISSVFQDAYQESRQFSLKKLIASFASAGADAPPAAQFRVLDCSYVLPSAEVSIAKHFHINTKVRPTIFLTNVDNAGSTPKKKSNSTDTSSNVITQVTEKHLKTGKMLMKFVKARVEQRSNKVETTQDLRSNCLDKPFCGLLLKGTTKPTSQLKNIMQTLLKEFGGSASTIPISFASMDSSVLYLKNLESEYLPELTGTNPRFVVFKKLGGSLSDTKAGRLITSVAVFPSDSASMTPASISQFVQKVVNGEVETQKIPALPQVQTRTKKLVEEEKAKKERKSKREQDAKSGSSSSEENDGSRDGRRAERERRRAEHYAAHNVKPKTPEEIAEMERQRRVRMAEEAEKWNIDNSEEGDSGASPGADADFEDFLDMDETEQDANENQGGSDAGEDEDDVLDLD